MTGPSQALANRSFLYSNAASSRLACPVASTTFGVDNAAADGVAPDPSAKPNSNKTTPNVSTILATDRTVKEKRMVDSGEDEADEDEADDDDDDDDNGNDDSDQDQDEDKSISLKLIVRVAAASDAICHRELARIIRTTSPSSLLDLPLNESTARDGLDRFDAGKKPMPLIYHLGDDLQPKRSSGRRNDKQNNNNNEDEEKKEEEQGEQDDRVNTFGRSRGIDKQKAKRDFGFAKNVLHYVPMTSRRYYRKSRNLASKSLSLKSLGTLEDVQPPPEFKARLKSRSLSRDELKYLTISRPSNFVHVASATRQHLIKDVESIEGLEDVTTARTRAAAAAAASSLVLGPDRKTEAKNLALQHRDKEDEEKKDQKQQLTASSGNDSFLWRMAKAKEAKDAAAPSRSTCYDDVGPVSDSRESSSLPLDSNKQLQLQLDSVKLDERVQQNTYDDIGLDFPSTWLKALDEQQSVEEEEELYDDIGSGRGKRRETSNEPLDTEEHEEAALSPDEDIYDDVAPLETFNKTTNLSSDCHERINSLYLDSSDTLQLTLQAVSAVDKESEWEDLDDFGASDERSRCKAAVDNASSTAPSHVCKKKTAVAQRWSRKVRRQRSRASRKSSARSTSRGGRPVTRIARNGHRNSVAVSLGSGSVLLLGCSSPAPANGQKNRDNVLAGITQEPQEHEKELDEDKKRTSGRGAERCCHCDAQVKGLVQLRLWLSQAGSEHEHEDEQETSLYVAEDSSDDSNYETLETYGLDDFSSESEAEQDSAGGSGSSTRLPSGQTPVTNRQPQDPHLSLRAALGPPPVPPLPKEPSLSHSLTRRMKMLKRTWSITKGSLGRMRRRASGDADSQQQQQPPQNNNQVSSSSSSTSSPGSFDAGSSKYFSFKRHFRKNSGLGSGSLSRFYLNEDAGKGCDGATTRQASVGSGAAVSQEPIYANTADRYRDAGLYREIDAAGTCYYSNSSRIDHYSVLAEEPLYQFYTADATRVAFESDSDPYEEVEEMTPSSATTDLAKNGHRTLWCQTPQVMNSGLLHRLSLEERKIQEAKFEILTSEASYLNSLRVLENEFASSPELCNEILSPAERDKLFGSVPEVLVASERFLAELEQVWREDPMLAKLAEQLLKHADRSAQVYVNYCSNQVSIDTQLKELRAKKGYRFLEVVSRIESNPACHSLSLHSFLMLPMQRITRLPLLADAVLSRLSVEHPERLKWELVLATLSHTVFKCNEAARVAERRNEIEALSRKLEYTEKIAPLSLTDRELIRSGTVVHLSIKSDSDKKLTFGKKFHKTPLMLFLLTDYLLVTKLKTNSSEETYSVLEMSKRSMVELESAPEDSPFAGRHAMVLTLLENHEGRQSQYVLTCDNDTERKRWLDAVSPPKPTTLGETLYESWDCPQVMGIYAYAPSQPDELALYPGVTVNVLRKMVDGWVYGERLLDGEQGWFPGNYTKEVVSEHVRARNLRQRHRFLALNGSVLQKRAKQSLSLL